jgi:hypothetical protein
MLFFALPDTDMFKPADKISRTPPSFADRSWRPDVAAGPLSSTHLDSSGSGRSSVGTPVVDPVAIRLFDQRANSPGSCVVHNEKLLVFSCAHFHIWPRFAWQNGAFVLGLCFLWQVAH